MKSNQFFRLLFNPFTRIAGLQAFGLGLIFVILTGITGIYNNVYFDGVLDMHIASDAAFSSSVFCIGISLVSLVMVMWVAGLITSKGIRFIDVLGTMTLSKAPSLLMTIAGFFTSAPNIDEIMSNPYSVFQSVSFIIVTLLMIPITIWIVVLMYNAFKVSSGLKGTKLTVTFIIALLVSEIISKILIFFAL